MTLYIKKHIEPFTEKPLQKKVSGETDIRSDEILYTPKDPKSGSENRLAKVSYS